MVCGREQEGASKKNIAIVTFYQTTCFHFLAAAAAAAGVDCLSTRLTIFCSSIRNARTMLSIDGGEQACRRLQNGKSVPVAHGLRRESATVGAVHRLLALRESAVLEGAKARELRNSSSSVSAAI